MDKILQNKTVVLGVTGSIAAYKIANLASMLVKKGAKVHVIMTKNATNFINPITFEPLREISVLWIPLTEILNLAWNMFHWQRRQMYLWWLLPVPML